MPPRVVIATASATFLLLAIAFFQIYIFPQPQHTPSVPLHIAELAHPFDSTKDARRLTFSDSECDTKFPGAFAELERAQARGKVTQELVNASKHGYLRARIHNGGVGAASHLRAALLT